MDNLNDLLTRFKEIEKKNKALAAENELLKNKLEQFDKIKADLFESEEKFRTIFEKNTSAIAIIDPDTTIKMVNEEYCKMGGFKMEDVIGKSWTTQIPPDDLSRLMDYNRKRLLDPSSAPDKYEFTFYHNNGEILHALMSVALIPGINKIITSFINITDRKKAEIELLNLAEELKELNKSKNLFFSIIAHDLRNPFSSIIGLTDLLLDNIQDYDITEIKKYVSMINTLAKGTFYFFEDLLVWAKTQDGKLIFEPMEFDIANLCNEVVSSVKIHADEKNISLNLIPASYNVFADVNMIKTVIRNLISNAIKFTNIGGNIEIVIELMNDDIIVIVSDNGIGIEENNLKKLWSISEKYTIPGTANEGGSGLGLVLCKEFVEKNKGKIWVESEYGKGSKFKFSLPKV